MKRGDTIICVAAGDFGKPRPALIVQSDLFNDTHNSVVICPITSHLIDAPLFRISVRPSGQNGLKVESQIMVDKVSTVKRERIRKTAGALTDSEMAKVDQALRLWLHLEPSAFF